MHAREKKRKNAPATLTAGKTRRIFRAEARKTKARLTVNSFFSDLRRQLIVSASFSSVGRAERVTPF